MRNFPWLLLILCTIALTTPGGASGNTLASDNALASDNILLVTAHPDDEAIFAATVYRFTHELEGIADLAVVTNGEGGYKYSDLAEPIYGLDLTQEATGRAYLPGIRKRELLAAGEIIKLRNYYFFDQVDTEYTLDLDPVWEAWDAEYIRQRLFDLLRSGQYGFVFVMLPTETTHAHHRASAILALEAVQLLPPEDRPIILGTTVSSREAAETYSYTGFPGYPITRILDEAAVFEFDRSSTFGRNDRLNYHIVVNWLIAEHKSQGTMQMLMQKHDLERFFYFALNSPEGIGKTRELFDRLTTKKDPAQP